MATLTMLPHRHRHFDWMVDSGSDLMNMRLKVLEFALWSEHIAYEKVV